MRVYFAPCGVGLGHVSRCEPVIRALLASGSEVAVSTYSDGLDYAKRKGFRIMQTVPIGFRVKPDGTVDFKMTAARSGLSLGVRTVIRQTLREIRNLRSFRPEVVVSDSRATPLIAARLLGIPSILILNQYRINIVRRPSIHRLTVFDSIFFIIANLLWIFVRTLIGKIWALAKVIVIPDIPPPYTISIGNLSIPRRYQSKVKLVGPMVTMRADDLPSQEELKRRLGFQSGRPLIYAAISGPRVERTYLADKLVRILSGFPDDYQVVLSRANPDGGVTPTMIGRVVVYDWIENEFQFMKACDLVVSRAGHGTIMKALALAKPMILIPIPDHTEQYGNAQRAAAIGVARVLPQESLSAETLLTEVKTALNPGHYAKRATDVSRQMAKFDALRSVQEFLRVISQRDRKRGIKKKGVT